TLPGGDGPNRSMLLQSGRYFDTVGWMSVKLDDNKTPRNLEFSRRYLDNNVPTYMFHTGKKHTSSFHTQQGEGITRHIQEMEKSEALTEVFGYLDSDYYLDREEWNEKAKNNHSIFDFYLDAVEATLVNNTMSPNWLFLSNWGILRGDIYKGPFTKSDFYAISPDDKSPFLYTTVTRDIADQIAKKVQDLEREEKSGSKKTPMPRPETLSAIQDESQSRFSLPQKSTASGRTYGWVTEDDCGGDGDDTPHVPIPQVDFDLPGRLPVYFWRKNYESQNLDDSASVHLIVTNRIGNGRVPKALKELGVVFEPNLLSYREDVRQDNLLEIYINKTFPSSGKDKA
ncbi:unnamed protein product, partial [Rhizoctonia solani]